MTGFVRARFAATAFLLSVAMWPAADARADVFLFDGEIFFCSTTCNSFGALGGSTGGSDNTTNSVVVGSLDIPVAGDGSFSFVAGDNTPFDFTITTSAIPFEDPVIGPTSTCPPPNNAGQICNPGTVNPLPLDNSVATIAGSGVVGPDGNFLSGTLTFVFIVAPFSNNGAVVVFDLDPAASPRAEGTVFGGALTFTRINGDFVPAPPELDVSMPVPDPFPATLVGATSSATVTVINDGLGVGVITLGAPSAPFSITTEDCTTGPLAGNGATCTIDLQFAPTVAGEQMGSLTVNAANNIPASISVGLVGNAIVPEIDVVPTDLTFVDVPIGESESLDVIVSNSGTANLTIPVDGVTALADPFSITADSCSDASLAPMASCTITVTYTPSVADAVSDSFDISSDDPNEPTITVTVAGTAAAPDISVMPQTLNFGSAVAGESRAAMVTVTNGGASSLELGTIDPGSIVAPFALVSDACSMMTLAPAGTCTLTFEFAPTVEGAFSNDYVIPSNDPDEPMLSARLEGTASTAAEPSIVVAPAELPLGDVIVSQMSMDIITVTNDGSAALTVSGISIAGDNAAEFTQANDCETGPVAPNATCEITLTFSPADLGARTATLTIESDASNQPMVDVELSGTGVLGPQITLSVEALALGSSDEPVELDASVSDSIMVISSGSVSANVAGLALSGDGAAEFSISGEDCTAGPLAPMQTCDVEITFAPVTAGDKTATLTVTSDDVDMREQTVVLTGFVLAGSRPELSVPEIEIGTSTAPVTVGESGNSEIEITNTGTDALLVVSVVLAGPDAAEFTLTEDCTAGPVDRTDSCTVDVTFIPTTPGTKTAEVQITSDSVVTRRASRAVQVTTVPIMATAVAPPPPPPPPPGSRTNVPPNFASGDTDSEGACFIATAAYGSYLDPNVQVLRDFRDEVLMRSSLGLRFVKFYYANSPMLADYIARHDSARIAARVALTPVVYAVAYPVPALGLLLVVYGLLRHRRRVRLQVS